MTSFGEAGDRARYSARAEALDAGSIVLLWTARALVATVWISAVIFGTYIIAFYFGAVSAGSPDQWNQALPRLYEPQTLIATIGMGAHFAAGTILLFLGPIQLIKPVREGMPRLHRWIGRLYGLSAMVTGFGGLVFIAAKGTVGGTPMTLGFSLYGALLVISAVETVRYALAKQYDRHRAWAIRLFALVIGSWLYRMDYGFWKVFHGVGHNHSFDGPFDIVMAFFFYVPNLIVAEVFIQARRLRTGAPVKLAAAVLLGAATLFLATATYYFTIEHWGPGIMKGLRAASR
jgi:Predicted membrane protein (DUF2306)